MKTIDEQAKKELAEERFRLLVNKKKEQMRRPWYRKIFPFKIKLIIERIK